MYASGASSINFKGQDLPRFDRVASQMREQHRVARTQLKLMSRSLAFPVAGNAAAAVCAGAMMRQTAPMRSEEYSCQKSWLFQRPPTRRGSPYWKMGTSAKSTSNVKKNLL